MTYEEIKALNLKKNDKIIIDYRGSKHEVIIIKMKEFKGKQSGKYFNGSYWVQYPEVMTISLELNFINKGYTDILQNQHINSIEVV